MPSAAADYYYVYFLRKTHGDTFRLLVKDREELARKVKTNDWDLDPRQMRYDTDEDDEEREEESLGRGSGTKSRSRVQASAS